MSTKTTKSVILVTGGSGLVGSAIKHIIESEPLNSRFGKKEGEEWVFARSSEGDLRSVESFYLIEIVRDCGDWHWGCDVMADDLVWLI